MQHIYSMRSSRPATAASIENPFAPASLAKSRRFISNNIGHAIRKTAGGTLDPTLAKKLAKLVAMEKNTLRSMETVSKERMDGAQALSAWAEEQEDDVSDVVDKVAVLINEIGDLEDQYVDRHDQYRASLKQIRNIEKVVQPIRDKKEKLTNQTAALEAEESPDALKLESLRHELVRVEAESLVAEQQLSAVTRENIKSGLEYQFDAIQEFGEKLAIIAGYGRHLLQLVQETTAAPDEAQQEYTSHEASAAIVRECDRALTTWVASHANVNATLPTRVLSMMSDRSDAEKVGETVGQETKPRLTRTWSTGSESELTAKKSVPATAVGLAA